MGEKNLWSKVGLIVLLVGLSLWQIFPLKERLKPGIDLGGGYSALFEIDDSADKRADLAERVMNILKQRIDPGSTRNLVWRPVGRNRLEIQMPKATGDTSARDNYERIRKDLLDTNISESQIRAALALPPAQRDQKFAELVAGVESRKPLLVALARSDDQYRRLSATAESLPAGTQPAVAATTQPGEELGAVIEARQARIADLLKTNLNVPTLLDRLELANRQIRTSEIEKMKKEHPDLTGNIAEMVTAYDKWSKHKGTLEDPSDLLRLLKGAGVLEFRILATRDSRNTEMISSSKPEYNERVEKYATQLQKRGPRADAGDKFAWFKIAKPEENSILENQGYYIVGDYLGTKYVLAHNTPDMGLLNDKTWSLVGAWAGHDNSGRLAVDFELDTRGGGKFARMTGENIERPLCIFLDSEAISAANIKSQISNRGQISGNFTPQEVGYLVNTLEAGALPARLKEVPIQERNVGPSLGATNIKWGLIAVTVSFVAVVAFMILYYAYNGAIADVALLMNLIITLGIMSFIGATFTLPGIAGLILTLGMAVDANVLIFERMREELQRGVSARMAVKLGYERAFSAIFDGNVTTIITAVILYWIGSEEIKGFGLTLGLGLTISMFTALFVTRQYYYVMVPQGLNREETRKAWLVPLALAGLCGVIVAMGWAANGFARSGLGESNLVGLGRFFGVMGLTAAVILGTMWGFRALYKFLGHQRANRLPMMKLMSAPKIDWMSKYRKFWIGSAVVIVAGLVFMAGVPKNQIMDIEFIGGTSVQVELKDQHKDLKDEELLEYVFGDKQPTVTSWLQNASQQLRQAKVTPAGEGRYVVSLPDKSYTDAQVEALLAAGLARRTDYVVERNGFQPQPDGMAVQFSVKNKERIPDQATAERLVRTDTADYVEGSVGRMRNTRIQSIKEGDRAAFDLITTETARSLVAESLMASSMRDLLEVSQSITATPMTDPQKAPDGIFPIPRDAAVLADVIGGEAREDISKFKGGLVLEFRDLQPAATVADIENRLKQMRLQPEFEATGFRDSKVFGLGQPAGTVTVTVDGKPQERQLYQRIAIAAVDPTVIYEQDGSNDDWRKQVAEPEKALAEAALARSQALQRVTQFAPQVASEAAQKAVIAVILAFIAIAGYMWVRFGSLDFGISGIIALYHDVAIALTAIVACHYLAGTWLGDLLMLRDFKIDLTIIAALLTLVGFSINDTIVIFDRIRENRGRLGTISPQLVNDSLNQTLSRTVLTSFTVLMVVVIMYVFGGEGIHGFAFAMIIGSLSGTYSTLAIATPMVMHPRAMWITTIFITAVTMVGITWNVPSPALRWILVVAVVALAVYGAYRQWIGAREEQALAPARREPTPV